MRKIKIAIALLTLLLSIPVANAHAFLDHAEPRVGNTVATAPRQVTLWFTQNLEPAFSGIEVREASGDRVDEGKAAVDGGDRHVMRMPLKALKPGTYKVYWHVLSVDTHTTEGNFSFSIGP